MPQNAGWFVLMVPQWRRIIFNSMRFTIQAIPGKNIIVVCGDLQFIFYSYKLMWTFLIGFCCCKCMLVLTINFRVQYALFNERNIFDIGIKQQSYHQFRYILCLNFSYFSISFLNCNKMCECTRKRVLQIKR